MYLITSLNKGIMYFYLFENKTFLNERILTSKIKNFFNTFLLYNLCVLMFLLMFFSFLIIYFFESDILFNFAINQRIEKNELQFENDVVNSIS